MDHAALFCLRRRVRGGAQNTSLSENDGVGPGLPILAAALHQCPLLRTLEYGATGWLMGQGQVEEAGTQRRAYTPPTWVGGASGRTSFRSCCLTNASVVALAQALPRCAALSELWYLDLHAGLERKGLGTMLTAVPPAEIRGGMRASPWGACH